MGNYAFVGEELSVKLYKEYQTTKISYTSGTNTKITINNIDFIEQMPITTITFKSTINNPTITFKNNSTTQTIQIPGNYVNNDVVVLDSRNKRATKNTNIILNISTFPIIYKNSYFEIYMPSSYGSIQLQHTSVEDTPLLTKSRDNFNLNWNGKQVELGKRFYNSTHKDNLKLNNNVSFDFTCVLFDDEYLNLINSADTYKLVYVLDNKDEYNIITRTICNCSLDVSVTSGENQLIKHKLSGVGVLLGTTPTLSSLFYQSDAIQVILTNLTKNLIMEIPYAEVNSTKFNTKYREKKIFRQPTKKIFESIEVSTDLSCLLTDSRIKDWIGDNLSVAVNYYNASGSIPIIINNAVIENLSFNSEKDGLIKTQLTLSGNL